LSNFTSHAKIVIFKVENNKNNVMKNIKNAPTKKNITIEDLAVTVSDLSVTVNNLAVTVNNLSDTVNNLAVAMRDGFQETNKRTDEKIDNLAIMTQRGFAETNGKIDGVKEELNAFHEEVNDRFDNVKNILYRAHDNRIEKIEDDVRMLKTVMKM